MAGPEAGGGLAIGDEGLARLMPMHALVDADGRLRSVGPTLRKLGAGRLVPGSLLDEHLAFQRPAGLPPAGDGARTGPVRVALALRRPPYTALRGLAVPLTDGSGWLLNLSLGISAVGAARTHGLTNADFAPTDLTVELLYLTEANAAVTGELAALNARLRSAHSLAERQSLTDALTGLGNRRALDRLLARLLGEGGRSARRGVAGTAGGGGGQRVPPAGTAGFALLHIDLDYFKAVNDTHGHSAGDAVLRHVARVLRDETRLVDTVARVGGDEFVTVLQGLCETGQVLSIARRIIARLEQPVAHEGRDCRVSASIGAVLSCAYERPEAGRMFADADAALYASKRAGRGRVTLGCPRGTMTAE